VKNLKILIRAVKDRKEYIEYLERNLPEAEFVFDETKNAMDTFLKALFVAGDSPCVHMEEDIMVTRNFLDKLRKAIVERPNRVIQFFSMRKADIEIGSRYDYGRNFLMNQCFYLPRGYSKLILDYYDLWERKLEHPTGCDIVVADFLKNKKEKYWIHVPSLVQHRQCKSLINPRRSAFRQSVTFVEGVE